MRLGPLPDPPTIPCPDPDYVVELAFSNDVNMRMFLDDMDSPEGAHIGGNPQ